MTRIYTIPPKPTRYAGVEFRSLLESEWAMFLDERLVRWVYEKASYRLPCRPWKKYTPDLWLPDYSVWAEIKNDDPLVHEGFTETEYRLACELCDRTGYPVILLIGQPHPGPHPILIRREGDVFRMNDWEF